MPAADVEDSGRLASAELSRWDEVDHDGMPVLLVDFESLAVHFPSAALEHEHLKQVRGVSLAGRLVRLVEGFGFEPIHSFFQCCYHLGIECGVRLPP